MVCAAAAGCVVSWADLAVFCEVDGMETAAQRVPPAVSRMAAVMTNAFFMVWSGIGWW